VAWTQSPSEAPTGFDDLTNGFTTQDVFDADRDTFDEAEFKADGLGPVYNAQACGQCHQNPTSGGISQVTELRAGHLSNGTFIDHPGGSLINDRAINANFQERVLGGNEVRTFRTSLNTLGDGFVECIDSNTLVAIQNGQPSSMKGTFIQVPVLEAGGALRGARFGWKNQHASLVSFSADAYLNEMGITTPLQPNDNTSNGSTVVNGVAVTDGVADPEDDGEDVEIFARFMRATKAPPRDNVLAATNDAQVGSTLFDQVGCAVCHVRNITTAPPGTVINGGAFTVPAALGNKVIHPFSDFMLHDVGTGDGIVQNGGAGSRNMVRTAALWGLRARNRFMHDGNSFTMTDAINRHAGTGGTFSRNFFNQLDANQKRQLLAFLSSL
jgi:CxxC motif-containing protein (DUF1111 family)